MVELDDIMKFEDVKDRNKNEAIKQLFKFDENADIKTKTDLNINDVKKLTRLKLISEIFNIDVINTLCENYCLYLVSKDRRGRTEVVDVVAEKKETIGEDSKKFFNNIFKK